MDTLASQITSLTIVYSTAYSDAHQRKHQSSASLVFAQMASYAENVPIWWRHHDVNDLYRFGVKKMKCQYVFFFKTMKCVKGKEANSQIQVIRMITKWSMICVSIRRL